jgi:starch-binding outer membrane protein, SusD/RagB family
MLSIKSKYIVAGFAALSIAATSCSKFLDRPVEGQLNATEALGSDVEIAAVLNSTFVTMGSNDFYGGKVQVLNELMGDHLDGILLTEDYGEIYKRKSSIFGGYKNDFYQRGYNVVTRCNRVLESLDNASEAARPNLEGQAKFQRALVHFEMVRLFAQPYGATSDNSHLGVPLRIESGISNTTRATVKQVYDQIIADLKDAETKLPVTNGNYPGKNAARAILAKVYFQMNDFANAYAYANLVMGAAGAATYQFVTSDTGLVRRFSAVGSRETIVKIVNQQNIFEPGSGLRDNFRSDTRRPVLFFTSAVRGLVSANGDKRGAWISTTLQAGINSLTKYNTDRFELPIVHVTEMKLIRAEAGAEVGGAALAVAVADVNDILTRAFGNTTFNLPANTAAADVIRVVRQQREIEMVGEGNRTQEIKRLGARTGANVDRRGAAWNCPGLALQFPQGEMAANTEFVRNPEGGCN